MNFENKLIKKTESYNRVLITNDSKFTIPETASLVCRGGGLFNGGVQIGNNNATMNGTLRYNGNGLQIRHNSFRKVATFEPGTDQEDSIVKFSSTGEIESTNIAVVGSENSGLDGVSEIMSSGTLKLSNPSQNINFLATPPTTSISNGEKGDFAWDENFIYICVSDNNWRRAELNTF